MQQPDVSDQTHSVFSNAGSYFADWFTPVVRVGVTGLARSGKTVFITALVNCLIEGGAVPAFARLRAVNGYRAYLEPQPDDDVPRFSFEDHIAKLVSAKPSWPMGTRQISQLRLTLEWDEPSTARRFQRFDVTQRLHVDIIDYPGEWLIDLAMLDQSFEEWSKEALSVIRSSAMGSVNGPFLKFLSGLDDKQTVDEATAIAGAEIFTEFLVAARRKSSAGNVLGPGRFLMPGDLEGSPQLTFFPITGFPINGFAVTGATSTKGATGETGGLALLERRFASYKSNVVKPFFEKHFARIDRQIVLVDVLSALNGGADALSELEFGIENVMRAFRPGKNTWLSRLLERRIDRIVFAATKADHVHASNRKRLEAILEKAVSRASKRAAGSGAKYTCIALSALRATQDVEKEVGGETFRCVRGVVEAGEEVSGKTFDGHTSAVVFPGDLPADPLDAFDSLKAKSAHFKFARFLPPTLETSSEEGITDGIGVKRPWPHINLDVAFSFLLGDHLP